MAQIVKISADFCGYEGHRIQGTKLLCPQVTLTSEVYCNNMRAPFGRVFLAVDLARYGGPGQVWWTWSGMMDLVRYDGPGQV